jgi:hypothetical protein
VAKGNPRALQFTPDEMQRLNAARMLVSAGDFHLTYAEFLHDGVMQVVDEVIGLGRSNAGRRHAEHMRALREKL